MKKLMVGLFVTILLTPFFVSAQPSKYVRVGVNYSSFRTEGRKSEPGKHALWFQGGFGTALADIYDRNRPMELFVHGDFSAHFRRHRRTISIGFHINGWDLWGIETFWGSYGFSSAKASFESTISAGIGFSRWYYHTETELGTIYSSYVPSLIVRAQAILHLRQLFGFGLVLTGNVNSESFYLAGGFVFSLGFWNL